MSGATAVSRSKNVRYVVGVDHLRGLAVILIIVYHGVQQISGRLWPLAGNPLAALIYEGHTAVALFMVLSGFIFTYGALDREVHYRPFIKNRLLRIAPMYLLVLTVAIYTTPKAYSLSGVLPYLTLHATPPLAVADLGAFGALLWTISVEFTFYLIFPFLIRFLRTSGPLYLLGLLAVMNALRLVSAGLNATNIRDLAYWTILGRLDQFVVGMLVGWVVVRRPVVLGRLARGGVLLAAGAALLIGIFVYNRNGGWLATAAWKSVWPLIEGLLWGSLVWAYLQASARWTGRVGRTAAWSGVISYSAYLLHYALVVLIAKHTPHLADDPLRNALLVTALVIIPATAALSTLTYLVIERPFMQMRVRYLTNLSAAATPSSG
ncbi:MAG: acyltransferase [Ilumatobacteraceae bacterium]